MTSYDPTQARRNVVRLKALQRASRRLAVTPLSPTSYRVTSASQPGRQYYVLIDPDTLSGQCTCAWAQHGGVNCKHVLAVLRAHFAEEGRGELSFWAEPADARRQHRPIIAGEHLFATVRRD